MEDSYHPQTDYDNVDVVVLSNIYHRHKNFWEKDKIFDHWNFSSAFNLIFFNPNKRAVKTEAIEKFAAIIPNHSVRVMNYIPNFEHLRITEFVSNELIRNGEFYFQPSF